MPVTFTVAQHSADPITSTRLDRIQSSPEGLLKNACRNQGKQCTEFLQSSLHDQDLSTLIPWNNGFVRTVLEAYNRHHHVVIRPDDVWIAILAQLNFYINAHAEELRHKFVAHEGKKELTVTAAGNRYSADFGAMSRQMADLLHENLVDKELHGWTIPDFTTTTTNDKTISAVILMSTLKAYFDFKMCLMCGIPSVTLEGEKSDWESILARLDKLDEFGAEPTEWARMLRPIVRSFISAFDGNPDIDFWSKVAHYSGGGSGPTYLSGWITAFCAWSSEGKWLGNEIGVPLKPPSNRYEENSRPLTLDGVIYPRVDTGDIPPGYCEVDVLLDDNGDEFRCLMVAGHVAMKGTAAQKDGPLDTVRPSPQWFMFIKGEVPDEQPHF
ncbi:hypothetical protein BOTBODRAFT_180718 [Botryobasidium botryosum FD-172 SS1]|uniref:DUF4419 domain-containing protein n=1 Tax=Botryobasidium botryosum (strain FD-172 SS1) TaxID=930990 RepID=A0A067M794_BOTB1|nr:hypothetical protein BOTBODRAFT_180718 [Botryobasidium botryosum FD-172 SS1]